jgi:hypothetical protein
VFFSFLDQLAPFFDPFQHSYILGMNLLDGISSGCLADVNNRKRLVE